MIQIISRRWLIIGCIVILPSILYAQSDGTAKKTLAILKLSANGVREGLVRELSDVLRMELEKIGTFTLIDYAKIESTLKEQGALSKFSCNQYTCAIEAGQLLGSDLVAIGSVGFIDKTYSMNVRVIDINSGRMIIDVDEYYNGKSKNLEKNIIGIVAAKLSGSPVPKISSKKASLVKAIAIGSGVAVTATIGLLLRNKLSEKGETVPMTKVSVQWN